MDLLGTVLLLVLVGSEAQNLVNVTVELGQDVTLTCSFNSGDIFWFMEIQNQFRIRIGQTLSVFPSYDYPDFKIKYLIEGNRLVIKNVSAEDSRLYFCSKNKTNPDGDSFLLISVTRPTSPSVHLNFSPSPSCSCESERLTFIIYRSAVILSFLLSLTALLCFTGRGRGWSRRMKLVQSAQ